MDTQTPVAEIVEAPPPPVAAEPVQVEEAVSISDHAEQFGPEKPERPAANTGQFADRPADGRHRSQSQRATPEDVAEINRLTKELRETEQRLGERDPDAKSSPRIRTLKRQIAALKLLDQPAETSKPKAEPIQERKPPVQAAPSTFSEKEPTLEDFASADDPYLALSRALAAYDRKKEAFESSKTAAVEQDHARQVETVQKHLGRMQAFAASKPDFQQVTSAFMARQLPGVLLAAIVEDDNGPDYVYHLAQHPDLVDELFLQTAPLPVNTETVATLQRRLSNLTKQAQAASTGSAAPARPTYIPPRPPNPVRTGPVKTSDEPPGEGASIAEHARYYDPNRRR